MKHIKIADKIHRKAKIAAINADKNLGEYTEEALTEKMSRDEAKERV